MLDIGGDELLMLLFVLDAEGDATGGFIFYRMLEKLLDRGINVSAIGEDEIERGAGEGRAELLFRHLSQGVVVAVEEPAEVCAKGSVVGEEFGKYKGLKKPTGMSKMPLDRAGFRTGLHHHVFRGEGSTERFRSIPDRLETVEERGGGIFGEGWHIGPFT
jgi:hypothetical protein